MLHEAHGMDGFNVELSEFYLQDLSSLKDTHISVSYRHKHGDAKKTYHQLEIGTIVFVPEKRSRKVMVKFRDGENAYPLTLNRKSWVQKANHVPKKQYKWRLLNLKAYAVKCGKE